MRFGKNWRKVWRYYSMQAMVAAGAVQTAWVALPDDLRASVPNDWVSYGTMALLAIGAWGRMLAQDDS